MSTSPYSPVVDTPLLDDDSSLSPASSIAESLPATPLVRVRQHINRPRNGFFIFRSEFCQQTKISNQQNVSKLAGEAWRALDEERREEYMARAKEESRLHLEKNPGYTYSPNKRRTSKAKKRQSSPAVQLDQRIRIIAAAPPMSTFPSPDSLLFQPPPLSGVVPAEPAPTPGVTCHETSSNVTETTQNMLSSPFPFSEDCRASLQLATEAFSTLWDASPSYPMDAMSPLNIFSDLPETVIGMDEVYVAGDGIYEPLLDTRDYISPSYSSDYDLKHLCDLTLAEMHVGLPAIGMDEVYATDDGCYEPLLDARYSMSPSHSSDYDLEPWCELTPAEMHVGLPATWKEMSDNDVIVLYPDLPRRHTVTDPSSMDFTEESLHQTDEHPLNSWSSF